MRRSCQLLCSLLLPIIAHAQSDSDEFKAAEADTDRWIEIQSSIAHAQADWKSEKALIEGTIDMLEAEQAILKESLESNKQANALLLNNRDRLRALADSNEAALQSLEQPMRELEQSLVTLFDKLPPPLQQEVRAQLAKLEDANSGEKASIPTRIQSLVASFTAIDRFSNSLNSVRETRPAVAGGEVSVRVLYWGLAGAYAIDDANQRAWVVQPSGTTWSWNQQDEFYPAISQMIASYENEVEDPRLVLVPGKIN